MEEEACMCQLCEVWYPESKMFKFKNKLYCEGCNDYMLKREVDNK